MMFTKHNFLRWLKKLALFTVLCLPIVLFLFPFVSNPDRVLFGDWDYFAQLYEAARKSIIEYNQFPWFNPWMSGGVPLYANPQFGLISIQTPLVLLFGTLVGLRLSVLIFFLLGFWGMRKLLVRLHTDIVIATLLSYIWVFSSFPVWRLAGGHFTFGTYFLAPWFFLLLLNIRKRFGWVWVGLFTAFLINQSMHYLTVHILMIATPLVLYQIWSSQKKHKLSLTDSIKPYVFSTLLIIPLTAHKAYYTLQYLHDFPRIPHFQDGVPFNLITAALTFRGTKILNPVDMFNGGLGWGEYAAYFGLVSLILIGYIIVRNLERVRSIDTKLWLLLGGLLLTLAIAYGDFGPFSPYGIMKNLPILNQMQVPSRWLGWFVFGAILLLARLPRKSIFVVLLAFTIVDVSLSSYNIMNRKQNEYQTPNKAQAIIKQQAFYKNTADFSISSLRLLHATQSNIGDIYGYEPIVGFGGDVNEGYVGLSARCAEDRIKTCTFVSNNALVEYWSPNYIKLKRIGPGTIVVNANPGSYWTVNGARVFASENVIAPSKVFVIDIPDNTIEMKIDPSVRVVSP